MHRYRPERALPPYAYVPGQTPHPHTDPKGHAYGQTVGEVVCPPADQWNRCSDFLWGVDLWNHDFPWEAHESWEGLWRGCGDPLQREFLRGLIQCAAARVQLLAKKPAGAATLLDRAHARLERVPADTGRYMGLAIQCFLPALRSAVQGAGPMPSIELSEG